jgi:hypothetical protein
MFGDMLRRRQSMRRRTIYAPQAIYALQQGFIS